VKAISLIQPWASAIALGHKKIETRSWKTKHRGWLAIHASKTVPKELWEDHVEITRLLGMATTLPRGEVIALARLKTVDLTQYIQGDLSFVERRLGNYATGRAAWIFDAVIPLPVGIPYKGAQSLWDFPYDPFQCDNCDGCGWHEGGSTIKTNCRTCGGSGIVLEPQIKKEKVNK
jgi:hypothetical protein